MVWAASQSGMLFTATRTVKGSTGQDMADTSLKEGSGDELARSLYYYLAYLEIPDLEDIQFQLGMGQATEQRRITPLKTFTDG